MSAKLGSVLHIASFTKGIPRDQVFSTINPTDIVSGDPDKLIEAAKRGDPNFYEGLKYNSAWEWTKASRPNDFNGSLLRLDHILATEKCVSVGWGVTDYFTLRGMLDADNSKVREAHRQSVHEIVNIGHTGIPIGMATHNILLITDPQHGQKCVVLKISAKGAGFQPGRVGMSFEEQGVPNDKHPFDVATRGLKEELGINNIEPRLLGVGMEDINAYSAWGFLFEAVLSKQSVLESWQRAQDFSENTSLFFVPVDEIDKWLAPGGIPPEVWRIYTTFEEDSRIGSEQVLQLHATVQWRAKLLKEYLAATAS